MSKYPRVIFSGVGPFARKYRFVNVRENKYVFERLELDAMNGDCWKEFGGICASLIASDTNEIALLTLLRFFDNPADQNDERAAEGYWDG